jgi:hypothetical protein
MGGLRFEDFSDEIGGIWEVGAGDATVPLHLAAAQALPGAMRAEGGFRLEWKGPAETILPQAIYSFRRDGNGFEMFIVPVARQGESILYEAIFS